MNEQSISIAIRDESIELYKLLKLAELATSGGEAKYMISQGLVLVNGEVETRKRKKIVARDIVEYDGGRIMVVSTVEKGIPEAG